MSIQLSDITEPDGTLADEASEAGTVLVRRQRPIEEQPAAVRRRIEAQAAITAWRDAEDSRAFHVSQGQAYYDARAPGAGLPTGAAAYNTATTFITNARDKAWERALAAINRWRLA